MFTIYFIAMVWILGTIIIFADKIGLESEAGQFWDYESRLQGIGINLVISLAGTSLIYLITRCFPFRVKTMKIIAWILGVGAGAWMLFISEYYLYLSSDPTDIFGAAGLWISYVDTQEEEKIVWNKSNWLGRGDDVWAA